MALSPPALASAKRSLLDHIRKDVVRTQETDAAIVDKDGNRLNWLLDFRRIFLNPDDLDILAELFWEHFASRLPFQIGGMESASIPLITAIVLKGKARGTPVRGFYIRKSRKKIGLLKQVEGELGDEPVVLVDDLINNGNTFLKQVVLLEALGRRVQSVFAVVRFNEPEHYPALTDKHIKIETLFDLKDIGLTKRASDESRRVRFITRWYFHGDGADLHRVERKSTPVVDVRNVYFGTDNGYVYALDQQDGTERWKFKVGLRARGPYAISNLARADSSLYFASRNGKVFALEAGTGLVQWVYAAADWCTPSIAVASEEKRLYVGINVGWFNKRNYLVALNMESGAELWRVAVSDLIGSITVDQTDLKRISIGCADGTFCIFSAEDGIPVWSYKTGGSIIGGSVRTPDGNIVFGSLDGFLYVLNERTGALVHKIEFDGGIATTPLILDHHIIVSSLDKYVYCIDADTATVVWKFETKGRIFADPAHINGRVYVGSDDSRLYELDPATGKSTAFFQTVERITNPVVYAPATSFYFLTTYANELYCLTEKAMSS